MPRVPSLRLHSASSQWVVKIGGKLTYLGRDRAAAETKYNSLLGAARREGSTAWSGKATATAEASCRFLEAVGTDHTRATLSRLKSRQPHRLLRSALNGQGEFFIWQTAWESWC
jgi:hypothetical protein